MILLSNEDIVDTIFSDEKNNKDLDSEGVVLSVCHAVQNALLEKNKDLVEQVRAGAELMVLNQALEDELKVMKRALATIAGFRVSQFMGPNDMALECVNVASSALNQSNIARDSDSPIH